MLGRLDRDVFAQPGVKYVMIFHGLNDIGTADPDAASQEAIGNRLIQAYKQIITRVHAFGIPIFCSTSTPFGAPPDPSVQGYSAATREQTRQKLNNWLRTSGALMLLSTSTQYFGTLVIRLLCIQKITPGITFTQMSRRLM